MKKGKHKTGKTFDRSTEPRIIGTVKKAILERLDKLEKSPHWVASQLRIRPATLYDFLTKPKATMRTDTAEKIFELLGLEIRPKGKR